jgi:hypothetical protein
MDKEFEESRTLNFGELGIFWRSPNRPVVMLMTLRKPRRAGLVGSDWKWKRRSCFINFIKLLKSTEKGIRE